MLPTMAESPIDRERLAAIRAREHAAFERRTQRSAELTARARRHMPDGVPMAWMAGLYAHRPVYVAHGDGCRFTDVDGNAYVDFNQADLSATCGFAPPAVLDAIAERATRGLQFLLPVEEGIEAAELLAERYGPPGWQFTLSASSATAEAIRLTRHRTGRELIVVFGGHYHGHLDDTLVTGDESSGRPELLGLNARAAADTRVVPFNDLAALDRALADGQVAALLIEPALTNVGIVLPEPGYLEGVRELTRRHGTILIHDETHTICAGPGGVTGEGGFEPDMLVIGKTIGGGIPVAAYGMSAEVADRIRDAVPIEDSDVGGIGGTLAGYALSMAAARAALGEVLTESAFARMIPLAERWERGATEVIQRHGAPWSVTRLGARAEYHFMPEPPRDGADQIEHADYDLERLLHLWVMNRGVLMTPFHNMALMSPATTETDVDRHTAAFDEALTALFG
jgi:glutamate-1-semialdehyde 2,1-aminomutase